DRLPPDDNLLWGLTFWSHGACRLDSKTPWSGAAISLVARRRAATACSRSVVRSIAWESRFAAEPRAPSPLPPCDHWILVSSLDPASPSRGSPRHGLGVLARLSP